MGSKAIFQIKLFILTPVNQASIGKLGKILDAQTENLGSFSGSMVLLLILMASHGVGAYDWRRCIPLIQPAKDLQMNTRGILSSSSYSPKTEFSLEYP